MLSTVADIAEVEVEIVTQRVFLVLALVLAYSVAQFAIATTATKTAASSTAVVSTHYYLDIAKLPF